MNKLVDIKKCEDVGDEVDNMVNRRVIASEEMIEK